MNRIIRLIVAAAAASLFAPILCAEADIAWRFRIEAPRVDHRCAIGADGRVYVQDSRGMVYAVSPGGLLAWPYDTGGQAEGPVVIDDAGVIYAASNPAGPDVVVHAINPDGTMRWTFPDQNTQGVVAGPAVGPDGRVYVVTEAIPGFGGRGAIALHATGQLAWSDIGDPFIVEDDGLGAEICFGPDHAGDAGAPPTQFYFAVDGSRRLYGFGVAGSQRFAAPIGNNNLSHQFQTAVGLNGDVYLPSFLGGAAGLALRAYAPTDGAVVWSYPADPYPTASEVHVGPDGTIYIAFQAVVDAIHPNGLRKWRHDEPGVYDGPVMSPTNGVIVVGGRLGSGLAGFFKGLDGDGETLWRIDLPPEGGLNQIPGSRAMFTSDGRRAYLSADFPGADPATAHCYLYAIDLSPAMPGDIDGDGDVDFGDLNVVLSNYGLVGQFLPGDLDDDGAVGFGDLNILLGAYGQGREPPPGHPSR